MNRERERKDKDRTNLGAQTSQIIRKLWATVCRPKTWTFATRFAETDNPRSTMSYAQPSDSSPQPSPSPISRMPTEVLVEIFLQLQRGGDEPCFFPSPHHPSVLSGQVCRQWRFIIFLTPQLWSAIKVTISSETPPSALAAIPQWFDRSGARPLALRLSILEGPTEFGHQLFDLVLATAHRWQTVELRARLFCAQGYLDGLRLRLPLMECLRVRVLPNESYRDALPIRDLDLLDDSPLLQTLHIDGTTHFHYRSLLPWIRLTTLHLAKVDVAYLSKILSICPSLVRCTYGIVVTGNRVPPPRLFFANMRWLDLEPHGWFQFWDVFVPPALESLTVRGCSRVGIVNCRGLVSLLSQVQALIILRLHHIVLDVADLIQILTLTPALVEFSYLPQVHFHSSSHRAAYPLVCIDDLHQNPRGPHSDDFSPLVPNLQRLTLGGDGNNATTPPCEWCINLVRSRWDGACEAVTRLRYVRFCFGTDWGGEWVSREVKSLREEGLDIELLDTVVLAEQQ
jgi:hypothetical protein